MKIKRNVKYLLLAILCIFQTRQLVYGQEDIEFIHGKWDLEKEIRNGKIVFDGPDTTELEHGMLDIIHPRYIHFLRGNLGESEGVALSNLFFTEQDFGLRGLLKKNLYDSIQYKYENKKIVGYDWKERYLNMAAELTIVDSNTIELVQTTKNSDNEETQTKYILSRDQSVKVQEYKAWSPDMKIIIRQEKQQEKLASSLGLNGEKKIELKKDDFRIDLFPIPQRTKDLYFGIYIVFSESQEAKIKFQNELLQKVDNPFLNSKKYFESTIDGYNSLNISTSNRTHFLFYENDENRCGKPSFFGKSLEWQVITFQLDDDLDVKITTGKIKKLPYNALYMHVFFDSNQDGIIENKEYSCTELIFN